MQNGFYKSAVLWLLCVPVILIPLVHTDKLIDLDLHPKSLAFGLYVLVLAVYAVVTNKRDQPFPGRRAWANSAVWFYAAYFIIVGAGLFFTINPADGLFTWLNTGTRLVFLVFSLFCFRSERTWLAPLALAVGVMVVCVSSIGFMQLAGAAVFYDIGRYAASFTNTNLFAEVLFMALPFLFYGVYMTERIKRYFLELCIGLALAGIFLCLSRAVWLALACGMLCTAGLWFWRERRFWKWGPGEWRMAAVVLMAAALTVLILKTNNTGTQKETTKKESSIPSPHTLNVRLRLWENSMNLVAAHPWLGGGPGSWKIEVLGEGVEGLKSVDNATFYQYPHNDFTGVLSENGIIGLAAFAGFFISVFYCAVALTARSFSSGNRLLGYSACFGTVGYMVFSFFSFPEGRTTQPMLLILLAVFVILAHGRSRPQKVMPASVPGRKAVLVFMALFPPALVWVASERLVSEWHMRGVHEKRDEQRWPLVIEGVERAQSPVYRMDPFSTPLSWYSGSAWFNQNDRERAFADFREAYSINPNHVHVLNNLGSCYSLKGDQQKAITLYRKALDINPRFTDARLNLAAVYFNERETEKAFETICDIVPGERHANLEPFTLAILKVALEKVASGTGDPRIKDFIKALYRDDRVLLKWFRTFKKGDCSFASLEKELKRVYAGRN